MGTRAERERIKAIMRVVISLIVLGAALFVILSRAFPDDYAKWAFGVVGLIIGYWLR